MATAASPLPAAPPPRSFVFINDTNPDDSKSKSKRKLVRAQAARGPHSNTVNGAKEEKNSTTTTKHQQLKRKQKERSAVTTFPLSLVGLEDLKTPTPVANTTTTKTERITIQVKEVRREDSSESLAESDDSNALSQPVKAITPPIKRSDSAEEYDYESPRSNLDKALIPRMPGTGWAAPFISHPDPEKPYIPMLVDHYLSNIAVDIPELDTGTPYILRLKWFPMVITSPSTLYIVLLTSASHFAAFNNMLPRSEIQMILLNLKHRTLTSINKEIRDCTALANPPPNPPMAYPATNATNLPYSTPPYDNATNATYPPFSSYPSDRPTYASQPQQQQDPNSQQRQPMMTDTIIGAVAKMASYEAMFGSPTLFHTHMRGLQNMITQRGGLHCLGLDGLLERMVLWIDINSAFLLGTKAYFRPGKPLAGQVGFGGVGGGEGLLGEEGRRGLDGFLGGMTYFERVRCMAEGFYP